MLTQVDNCHQWRTMKLQQGNCRTRKTPSMQYRFNLRSAYEYTLHIQYQTMLQTIHAQVRIRIYVIHTILDHVIEHQCIGQHTNIRYTYNTRPCYRTSMDRSAYEYTLHIQYQTMLQNINAQVRIRTKRFTTSLGKAIELYVCFHCVHYLSSTHCVTKPL